MIVKCIYTKGRDLQKHEYKQLKEGELGRFGATSFTSYGEVGLGDEYLVMGMVMFQTYLSYVIDDRGGVWALPCQLFEVKDPKLTQDWHFRLLEEDENIYPYVQAIWGYRELCFDKKSYENLLVEGEEEYKKIYFRRKIEIEKKYKMGKVY